jgi:hypothetical protein
MMATKGEKYEGLLDFLKDSFKPPELQRFLKLRGFAEVAEAVNQHDRGTEYFFDVIEALDQRGLIDGEFFDSLAKARPKKRPQVKDLEAFWLDEDRARSRPSSEELAAQVKSAPTLVELVWCMGKYAQVKIPGVPEPVELTSLHTEVRIVSPTVHRRRRALSDPEPSGGDPPARPGAGRADGRSACSRRRRVHGPDRDR